VRSTCIHEAATPNFCQVAEYLVATCSPHQANSELLHYEGHNKFFVFFRANDPVRSDVMKSRDGSVGKVTRPQAGRFPAHRWKFSLLPVFQTGPGAHPAFFSMDTWSYNSGGQSDKGVKLTNHLRLVPRLRMRGALHVILPYALMQWIYTTFPYLFIYTFFGVTRL
jgi:hypothetical protein